MDGFKLLEMVGLEMDLPVISECGSLPPKHAAAARSISPQMHGVAHRSAHAWRDALPELFPD
jgi:hypothetical protein